ncbi:MAG: phosphatase PAP2 family protein [Bacteroidetes bacterium]|nr:phosphatase PAP2 family protein [Bacteroidota bacterium]
MRDRGREVAHAQDATTLPGTSHPADILRNRGREDGHAFSRFADDFIAAAGDVCSWYDAPLYLVYLANRYDIVSKDAKPIVLTPSDAERALARGLGTAGSSSPGSMEPFTVPHIILGVRALHAAGTALFGENPDVRGELRHSLGLYKTLVYTQIGTQLAKNLVHRVRPDESDSKSFFSGHTSTTFAMSSYLQREIDHALQDWSALEQSAFLRDVLRITSAAVLYGWAGYVGYSRMRDSKHYLTDVLVGAAIGSLMGHLVYDSVSGGDASILPSVSFSTGSDGPLLSLQMHF